MGAIITNTFFEEYKIIGIICIISMGILGILWCGVFVKYMWRYRVSQMIYNEIFSLENEMEK